jgi:hypothetical protein
MHTATTTATTPSQTVAMSTESCLVHFTDGAPVLQARFYHPPLLPLIRFTLLGRMPCWFMPLAAPDPHPAFALCHVVIRQERRPAGHPRALKHFGDHLRTRRLDRVLQQRQLGPQLDGRMMPKPATVAVAGERASEYSELPCGSRPILSAKHA